MVRCVCPWTAQGDRAGGAEGELGTAPLPAGAAQDWGRRMGHPNSHLQRFDECVISRSTGSVEEVWENQPGLVSL